MGLYERFYWLFQRVLYDLNARDKNYRLVFTHNISDNCKGEVVRLTRTVAIRPDLELLDMIQTIAHEAFHVMQFHSPEWQPVRQDNKAAFEKAAEDFCRLYGWYYYWLLRGPQRRIYL